MIKFTHAAIFGGLLGIALAVIGYPFTTWQYWLIFALFIASYFTKPVPEADSGGDRESL